MRLGAAAVNSGSTDGVELSGLLTEPSLMLVAAFMPFTLLRLLDVMGAAAVAQGISSAPARAVREGIQLGYYARGLHALARGGTPPAAAAAAGAGPGGSGGGPGELGSGPRPAGLGPGPGPGGGLGSGWRPLPELAKGRALWKVSGRSVVVQHVVAPAERRLTDTDARLLI